MVRFPKLAAVFAFAAVPLFPGAARTQSQSNSSSAAYPAKPLSAESSGASYKTTPLPPVEHISPSSFHTSSAAVAHAIVFRSEDQMTAADRALVAGAEPSIHDDATLSGFDFDIGKWSFQQLECQALPDHLFLLFKGDNGKGDVSLFSAAIWRPAKDQARVIPIQRRGFSLFSPAPVNPLTISVFNRVRAEEPASRNADWLSTALCYAALTGAHPQVSLSPDKSSGAELSLAFPPTLEIGSFGESTVRFVDLAAGNVPVQWALTFDLKGNLVKVVRVASPPYQITPLPPLSGQQSRAPVQPRMAGPD